MIKNDKFMLVIAGIVLAVTASLLWVKITLNSDILFLESLSRDLFDLGGKWSDWRFTPAPAYFPDMILYFLSYKILPNAAARIFFVSVSQVFLLAWAVLWLSKQIYPRVTSAALAALLLLIAFITLVAANSGMWLYFYTTNNHFAAILLSLVCFGLVIRLYAHPSLRDAVLLLFFSGIAQASTAIYFISFLAPAFIMALLVIAIALNSRQSQRIFLGRVIWIFILLIASYLLSVLFGLVLTYNSPLDSNRIPRTFDAITHSFNLFLQATANSFFHDNIFTFLLSILFALCALFLIFKLLKSIKFKENSIFITSSAYCRAQSESWRLMLSEFFLLIVIPVNVVGVIFSGGFADLAGYRYLAFPISLVFILTVLFIDSTAFFSSKKWKAGFVVCSLGIICLSAQFFKENSFSMNHNSPVVECLIEIEKGGFNLQAGVSEYWNARAITEYLPQKNWILATVNDMNPFFWMTTIGPLRQPERYEYNFLILDGEKNKSPFNYTAKTIGRLVPEPSKIYVCTGGNAEIWLYSNNSLDGVIKNASNRFLLDRDRAERAINSL